MTPWWQRLAVAAWLCLPVYFGVVLAHVYLVVAGWLDFRHRDRLPLDAGGWLRERVAQLSPPSLRVLPSLLGSTAYYEPKSKSIVLSQKVFYKNDPTSWAIAAHELGHALFHRDRPFIGMLLLRVRTLASLLGVTAPSLVLINLLYGAPLANDVAQAMLLGAVALTPLTLADELVASSRAMRILHDEPRLAPAERRTALLQLGAALCTYLAGLVALLAALALLPRVRAIVEALPLAPPFAPPLEGVRRGLAIAATMLLAARFGTAMMRWLRPGGPRKLRSHPLWDLPLIALVVLVWNQPLGLAFMAAIILAVASAMRILRFALVPLSVPAVILSSLVGRIEWVERMTLGEAWAARLHSPREIAAEVERARPEVEGIREGASVLGRMLDGALELAFLPALILLWWR